MPYIRIFAAMNLSTYPAQDLLRDGKWTAYFKFEQYDIGLLLAGLTVLAAAFIPRLIREKRLITAPLLYLAIGAAIAFLPLFGEKPDLKEEIGWVKRITELVVIIALTGAGLKLNKPFAKSTWKHAKRLLIVGMPLTMILTFALGHYVFGFALATAALLAAVIAPTDPVLAADVQTTPPGEEDRSPTRVALTAEAGVNDGLAFPFTYLAMGIAMAAPGDWEWVWSWFLMDFVYKIAAGILVGWAAGRLLNMAIVAFPAEERIAKLSTGIAALGLTLVPYAVAELTGCYGFVAVFVAACVFRHYEADSGYQKPLHDFSEESERILIAVIFVLLGIYTATDLFTFITWGHLIFALALIFIIRPVAGMAGLLGSSLQRREKLTMAFFGIRGIGSLYYLSYALYHEDFDGSEAAFALVVLVILISVTAHGLGAPGAVEKPEEVEVQMREERAS